MIKVENFYLNLGNFKLKNINFSVEDDQYCILLGPSYGMYSRIEETRQGENLFEWT